jgi:hypothetical protein
VTNTRKGSTKQFSTTIQVTRAEATFNQLETAENPAQLNNAIKNVAQIKNQSATQMESLLTTVKAQVALLDKNDETYASQV